MFFGADDGTSFLREIPVAVPEKAFGRCRVFPSAFSTAATPYCSLDPPPAALANVPTAVATVRRTVAKSRLSSPVHIQRKTCHLKREEK